MIQGLGLSEDILTSEMSSLRDSEKVKVLLAQALFGNAFHQKGAKRAGKNTEIHVSISYFLDSFPTLFYSYTTFFDV